MYIFSVSFIIPLINYCYNWNEKKKEKLATEIQKPFFPPSLHQFCFVLGGLYLRGKIR